MSNLCLFLVSVGHVARSKGNCVSKYERRKKRRPKVKAGDEEKEEEEEGEQGNRNLHKRMTRMMMLTGLRLVLELRLSKRWMRH